MAFCLWCRMLQCLVAVLTNTYKTFLQFPTNELLYESPSTGFILNLLTVRRFLDSASLFLKAVEFTEFAYCTDKAMLQCT